MKTPTREEREFVLREGIECSLLELNRLALSLACARRTLERARDVLLDDARDEGEEVQS
jgi:hypothetical protein